MRICLKGLPPTTQRGTEVGGVAVLIVPAALLPRPAHAQQQEKLAASTAAVQGTLKIVSSPAGAKVSIDGDAAGSTPVTAKRDPGTYVVTVELPGFAPASRQVEVAAGKTALVNER